MIFNMLDGERVFVMHSPNEAPDERVALYKAEDTGDSIRISKKSLL